MDRHARVRPFQPADLAGVRDCIVALQEFERTIDPRLRPGEEMADEYWAHIQSQCATSNGCVLVVELDEHVAGFAVVLASQAATEPDDPPGTHAALTDLAVLPAHRHRGLGTALLRAAEAYAVRHGATEVRVNVLTANHGARSLYLGAGYAPYLETLAKPLRTPPA